MNRLCALTCAGLMMAGCAGRDAVPVSAYLPNDKEMSCREVDTEIQRNNDLLRAKVREVADTEQRNIVVGAAALILFLPAALAMDLKDAAGTEANSLEQRNAVLAQLAAKGRCRTARPLTVADADAERVAAEVAVREAGTPVDAPGVRTPTDQRLHQTSGVASPTVVQASAGSTGVGRDRLQDLMDRFLRGEISKAEYERLRAG
ncbi:MAG: hypothetical protein RLO51_02275 [Thalassobaculum sp.]|uniref:hypothetical protein n=1 Tax=Thalassobaculum sp. TaxID=2022740 RepID=UPI0032EF6A9E